VDLAPLLRTSIPAGAPQRWFFARLRQSHKSHPFPRNSLSRRNRRKISIQDQHSHERNRDDDVHTERHEESRR
jgi:hypothetical protein